jgi:hypothetical protein
VGFVANNLCGSVTIFGHIFFRAFPIVNPIKKACCNVVKDDEIVEVVGHVDVILIGYKVILV